MSRAQILIAVLLPTAIAASDQFVILSFERPVRDTIGLRNIFVCIWFVGQVAIASLVTGRFLAGALRWSIFVWTLLLVDVLTFSFAAQPGNKESAFMLVMAIQSAQIGAAVVWGMLSQRHWIVRLPIAGAVVLFLAYGFSGGMIGELSVFFSQVILLSVICGVGRWQGWNLLYDRRGAAEPSGFVGKNVTQFQLRHLFVLTTSVAVITGLGRSLQATLSRTYWDWTWALWMLESCLAVALAMSLACAIWATLGVASLWRRMAVLVGSSLIVGATLVFVLEPVVQALVSNRNRGLFNWTMWSFPTGWKWVWFVWVTLAAGFLSATLLFFRELGYRLVRNGR